MKTKAYRKITAAVDVLFGILTLYCFYLYIRKILTWEPGIDINFRLVCTSLLVAVAVHFMKALRLYVILFEHKIDFLSYLDTYAKTAMISLLLPYKSGELYRGFRIGRLISSGIQGYIVVLFDRFIDTLALVTLILLTLFFVEISIIPIYVIFALFIVFIITVYCLFPSLYQFWNHFLIFSRSSKNTLKALQFLQFCNRAYQSVNEVARGRFLMLYLLSVIAWLVEVGGLLTVGGFSSTRVGNYLADVMLGNPNSENMVYILLCFTVFCVLSIITYLLRACRGTDK